jgi:hypothetical protein
LEKQEDFQQRSAFPRVSALCISDENFLLQIFVIISAYSANNEFKHYYVKEVIIGDVRGIYILINNCFVKITFFMQFFS